MNPVNPDTLGEAGAELDSLHTADVFCACWDPCERAVDISLVSFTNNVYAGQGLKLFFFFFFVSEKS